MTAEGPIRVVIADEQTLFREGLKALLQKDTHLEIVGEASSAITVVDVIKATEPDILLLDLLLVRTNDSPILSQLREMSSCTKSLLLFAQFDHRLAFQGLRHGAKGYLSKTTPCSQLVYAIRKVHAGQAWMERSAMSQFIEALPHLSEQDIAPQPTDLDRVLSPREREISGLVARGCSNKEIAAQLSISEKTVKSHLIKIFRKLHVNDRLQLALHVVQQNPAMIKALGER